MASDGVLAHGYVSAWAAPPGRGNRSLRPNLQEF
jgi:hypothetical protein